MFIIIFGKLSFPTFCYTVIQKNVAVHSYNASCLCEVSKPHHLVLHLNPDWFYLTRVVLERRLLNGCNSSSSSFYVA